MKNYIFIIVTLCFLNSFSLIGQNQDTPCNCCTENYNQFDFWIGNWEVYDTNEKLVGTNSISKQYDNCLIQEKWVSKGKNRGTSTNYFDKTDNTWNQIWVDNSGYVLKLKGSFINGSMVLKSELKEGKKGLYYDQISWTKNKNGTVTQLWEIFNSKDEKITEAFHGIYKKKLNSATN